MKPTINRMMPSVIINSPYLVDVMALSYPRRWQPSHAVPGRGVCMRTSRGAAVRPGTHSPRGAQNTSASQLTTAVGGPEAAAARR